MMNIAAQNTPPAPTPLIGEIDQSHQKLRVVVHDYAGHAFPFDLCKELARRGHTVQHLYFSQCQAPQAVGAKGLAEGYRSTGLSISGNFQKFSFVKRRFQEIEYGKVAARAIVAARPDVVISANTPIDSQLEINALCRQHRIPMVHWLQDVASVAMDHILPQKIPVFGKPIAKFYRFQEARMLRQADAVVVITKHFLDICAQMGVSLDACHVIENWAPLAEIQPKPRHNAWSEEHNLTDKRVLLYSGTLGFKHNPAIFERLAVHFSPQSDVRIVVVSEGLGADWLAQRKAEQNLENLILLPYQPYDRLSEVLATGDLLLALLEESAGIFSVPSKVLSYLSAGKPILLSVPLSNLAAETVQSAEAGRAIAPHDVDGLIRAADDMLTNNSMSETFCRNARSYAETKFNIESIGNHFEKIFLGIMDKKK